MEAFAGGHGDGIVMVYPRSCAWFTVASRIAGRMGWRILAFSTEALTDVQIDARTRTDYIHRVSTCSDAIWAVSTHLAEFWREHGVPNERVITIPPMVRAGNFADIQVVPKRQSAVYIGSLAHREIDYLLDIAAMIRSQLPSFSLTIYGDAPEARRQALRSEIAAKDLTATVSVESAVAPTMVPHILKHAQVLLLPRARGEFSTAGFPNKLGEYLASGRPVVVTGVGDIPHYLTHGKDAFIVRPDDCRAFADETVRVLVGPELSDQVGACGRRFAEQHLRADLVASRILEFVQSVPRNERCRPLPTRQWVSLSRLLQASIDVESGKRAVVRVLRALRLKPPAPSSGRG
jgi:glycosyltransferase involved in cell wall biosynthesis